MLDCDALLAQSRTSAIDTPVDESPQVWDGEWGEVPVVLTTVCVSALQEMMSTPPAVVSMDVAGKKTTVMFDTGAIPGAMVSRQVAAMHGLAVLQLPASHQLNIVGVSGQSTGSRVTEYVTGVPFSQNNVGAFVSDAYVHPTPPRVGFLVGRRTLIQEGIASLPKGVALHNGSDRERFMPFDPHTVGVAAGGVSPLVGAVPFLPGVDMVVPGAAQMMALHAGLADAATVAAAKAEILGIPSMPGVPDAAFAEQWTRTPISGVGCGR